MRLGRHFRHTLEGEAHTYFIYIRMSAEEAVVITLASSQTVTGCIKCHTWHQCEVYLVKSDERLPYWLHDMKGTLLKILTRSIVAQFHRLITCHLG